MSMYGCTSYALPLDIGAGALPLVREQIDPSLVERAIDRRHVVGAERRHCCSDVRLRLLRRVLEIHRTDERRIQIVVVELVDAHHPLPQFQVAMK